MMNPMLSITLSALLMAVPGHELDHDDLTPLVEKCVELLLERQEALDGHKVLGEWPYEGVYRERGNIPPGYRVGGTAIAAWALLETSQYAASEEVRQAVERALDFILDELREKAMGIGFSNSYDVRGWGHTYALQFLLELRGKDLVAKKHKRALNKRVSWLVKALEETAIEKTGGWNYARRGTAPAASPFMTAPTLIALWEARRQGEKVDSRVLEEALDSLEKCRTDEGAIAYSSSQAMPKLPGSIARTPIVEAVLYAADRSSLEDVEVAVEAFFEHWNELEVRRKKNGTHVAPYGVAPYYFFYGHYYASVAIELLPEGTRKKWRTRYLDTLLSVREESGAFNDRVFPRSAAFGTSMALLSMLEPGRPRPSASKKAARSR
jgi:hypothetical protein